jgi:hypothetical protein
MLVTVMFVNVCCHLAVPPGPPPTIESFSRSTTTPPTFSLSHFSLPYKMSSTYTLWCLVDGANTLFDVSIQTDSNISHLKRRIKQECSPDLDKFSAANLILWQVCYFR